MDERIEKLLRELLDEQRELKGNVYDTNRNLARLINTLDEDAEREARSAREEAERRSRHEASTRNAMSVRDDTVVKAVGEVRATVEDVGKSLRNLPDRLLQHVEKKIYELRKARYDLQQQQHPQTDGEALPLPPPPRREPTGQQDIITGQIVAHARGEREDDTKPFARRHRDGERRHLHEIVGGVVVFVASKSWRWIAATGAGAGLAHILHKLGIM